MSGRVIAAAPLTAQAFSAFGEVIETRSARRVEINAGRFERFVNLATIDSRARDGRTNLSLFRCALASQLPLDIPLIERHPLGSQAFYPLTTRPFFVVVAPPADVPDVDALCAFVSDGRQGVNLHRGVWHMPLIGTAVGEEFLVIDRGGDDNCDEAELPAGVVLVEG